LRGWCENGLDAGFWILDAGNQLFEESKDFSKGGFWVL
jgi:hypothetical protein